jgi:hypothetical protein
MSLHAGILRYERREYIRCIGKYSRNESYTVYRNGEYSFYVERYVYRDGCVHVYAIRNGNLLHEFHSESER